ncbi:PLP-dependent aminotransferase family protein [Shewanella schlegeliana]|uniref:PLP-dependent aminotransferase family protein n=1 Tax=Shewanella schlegeliana TaxID=190308 RepID=A0ABS1STY3_9GAMM|nr:PLP-dependent aminotransferase family protein [Shewanella schlegeliana]MBL4911859.1 PLP-dependent aminotransferase family protein [Shewanella schlegeliana]MCL1110188.1 PLP-dependent aminotransferase family protein [Shewanella schlegeliana]GIU27127.1 GntR family transcriptional regulator [Shewanella schlegeliana]
MGTIWSPNLENYTGAKYSRLAQAAEDAIKSGELTAHAKLPPQRLLADKLGITVGTVTRAYALLEQRGYVQAKVGAGTFVKSSDFRATDQKANFATCQQPFTNQTAVLSDALNQLAKTPQRLTQLMQYHAEPLSEHQLKFSQWLHRRNIPQMSEQIVFTHGGQQGLFSILNGLMQAGESLLCEASCYPGIHVAAEQLGLKTIPVSLTDEGLNLAELEQKMVQCKPKVLYLTPNNQNPTCIQYSAAQREAIITLARSNQVVIIEDDVNYCLPNEWHTPMWSLDQTANEDQQCVIYLSSLSKMFCGGLRQGFLLIPSRIIGPVKKAIYSQCWMVSPLNTELACLIIENNDFMGQREQLIANRQALCIAMGERLQLKQTWRGLNGWLQLKAPLKAHHVVTALAQKGILIRNGDDFNNHDNFIRLSTGAALDEQQFSQQLNIIESTIRQLKQSAYSVV